MEHKVAELAACRDSLAIRRRLAGLDPTNAQWRHDEACILDHIGNVYRKAGKAQDAIAVYEESVAIWRRLANLARRDRQRQLNVAMSLRKLGDVKLEAADHKGAIAAYEECVVFWRRVLKTDPDNTRWLSSFAETLERLATSNSRLAKTMGRLRPTKKCFPLTASWLESMPTTPNGNGILSLSLDRIGEANLILGNLNAAGAAYDESLIIRRRLVDLDLLNALWQDGIALVQKKIVELRRAVEAQALAEARVSRPELSLGPDKTSLEPKEQLLLTVGNIRNVRSHRQKGASRLQREFRSRPQFNSTKCNAEGRRGLSQAVPVSRTEYESQNPFATILEERRGFHGKLLSKSKGRCARLRTHNRDCKARADQIAVLVRR